MKVVTLSLLFSALALTSLPGGEDWMRFRGPNGSGVSSSSENAPLTWSDTENLKWKLALPGPGASSPIVVGDRVFVTCWSGYATGTEDSGTLADLNRHLLCVDRDTGKLLWQKDIAAILPEDESGRMLDEHGYASHTPASDGERVFVYFGSTGALAYDLDGKQLWHTKTKAGHTTRGWGGAGSPIVHGDLVIVNGSEPAGVVYGLKRDTGEIAWEVGEETLAGIYGSPAIMRVNEEREDLILPVIGEVWGINPESGGLRWYAESGISNQVSASPIIAGEHVVVFGGRESRAFVIRGGGKGDVGESHEAWRGSGSKLTAPIEDNGKLYYVSDRGIAMCVDLKTGEEVWAKRVEGAAGGSSRGSLFYASVVRSGDRMYAVSRFNGTFVFRVSEEFEQLAQNRFASDDSIFNATPAVANDALFLRSNRFLYCVRASE